MQDLSPETYIAFGRLSVAFGRVEGQMNWIMSQLLIYRDGKGHGVQSWHVGRPRGPRPESWDAPLEEKRQKVKELAHDCLPPDLRDSVVAFAGTVKELSDERRRLVHANVSWELSPGPEPDLSIFRTGPKGFAQESVNLREVKDLATRMEAAAQTSLDLLTGLNEFTFSNPRTRSRTP
jgi:hypothetical protein